MLRRMIPEDLIGKYFLRSLTSRMGWPLRSPPALSAATWGRVMDVILSSSPVLGGDGPGSGRRVVASLVRPVRPHRVGLRELDQVRRDLRQHLGLVDRVGVGQVAP